MTRRARARSAYGLESLLAEVDVAEALLELAELRAAQPLDTFLAEVDVAEATIELEARRQQVRRRIIPPDARRSALEHELAAETRFADLADDRARASEAIARRLADDRDAMLELIEADLAKLPTREATVARLLELEAAGIAAIPGADALIASSTEAVAAILTETFTQAAERVAEEAARQGVRFTPPGLTADDEGDLLAQATRLAQGPHLDLVKALRERIMANVGEGSSF